MSYPYTRKSLNIERFQPYTLTITHPTSGCLKNGFTKLKKNLYVYVTGILFLLGKQNFNSYRQRRRNILSWKNTESKTTAKSGYWTQIRHEQSMGQNKDKKSVTLTRLFLYNSSSDNDISNADAQTGKR